MTSSSPPPSGAPPPGRGAPAPEPTAPLPPSPSELGLTELVLTEVVRTTVSGSRSAAPAPETVATVQEFHHVFDAAVGGVGVTDLDGRLLGANPALQQMLHRPQHGPAPTSSNPDPLRGTQGSLDALVYGGRTTVEPAEGDGHTTGSTIHVLVSVTDVLDGLGAPSHLVVRVDDVADYVRRTDELAHRVLHDELTGLPNRALFLDRLDHEVARRERSGEPTAVLYLDVDEFKTINDTHGHAAGDAVLEAIGQRLTALLRSGDTAARLGGDEFALLCGSADTATAHQVANRVRQAMRVPVTTGAGDLDVAVSVGTASTQQHPGLDARGLVQAADTAMYAMKRSRRRGRERALPDPLPEREAPTAWLAQVRSVYQPIVDLDTRVVIGYEALARGPRGALSTPEALFAAARSQGLVADLDWVCRLAALNGAVHAQLPPTLDLFINAEPEALQAAPPSGATAALVRAAGLSVIMEITERDLTSDPAGLLRAADQARARGWRIAVDDVGANRASLALLPFLRPDVIKLDLRLVQAHTTVDIAEIISAVNAQAERTGALVLAEGIETEAQAQLALMMGARLGQGWLFGRPAPLPSVFPVRPTQLAVAVASQTSGPRFEPAQSTPLGAMSTPFQLVAAGGQVRRATKPLLLAISQQLERQALSLGAGAVVLTTLQHHQFLTTATLLRYQALATSAAYVALFGAGIPTEPAAGVRGITLAEDDQLALEWSVIVVGPYFTGAMLAHSLGDTGHDTDRRFDYTVTYDRTVVVAAATLLMRRIHNPAADSSTTADPRATSEPG